MVPKHMKLQIIFPANLYCLWKIQWEFVVVLPRCFIKGPTVQNNRFWVVPRVVVLYRFECKVFCGKKVPTEAGVLAHNKKFLQPQRMFTTDKVLDNQWVSSGEDLHCVGSFVALEVNHRILCEEQDVSKNPKNKKQFQLRIRVIKAKRINQVTFRFIILFSNSQKKNVNNIEPLAIFTFCGLNYLLLFNCR